MRRFPAYSPVAETAFLGLLGLLAGCSIHPLPEDVAPLNTIEIVDHIRCETYAALREQIILAFEYSSSPQARKVAVTIRDNPAVPLQDFEKQTSLLDDLYQKRIVAFKKTTIGYGFRFNITEQDFAKNEANFGLPWNPLASFSLKAVTSIDKKRANTRRFYKVDTFDELLFSKDCLAKPLNRANIVYPITGTIGIKGVVNDFITLTTRGAKTDTTDSKDVKSFSEQLSFTTEIYGSLTPKVKLAPVIDKFKLADNATDLSVKRTDVHELTLVFAVAAKFDPLSVAASAPGRRAEVINELNSLRTLDAIQRSGGIVVP